MRARVLAFTIAATLAAGLAPAGAQTPPGRSPRVLASVDGGFQVTSSAAESTVTYKVYGEDASVTADYRTETGPAFGVRAGVRVWRGLVVGAGVGLFSDDGTAAVRASLPHPFYFRRPRQVEGSAPGMTHDETVVFGEVGWLVALNARFDLTVFAGPAYFSVTRRAVSAVNYSESYPFDTATFTSAGSVSRDVTATGYTVGADLTCRLTPNIGVGALFRFSRATAEVEPASGQPFRIDLGGGQALAGLRVRF